MANWSATDWIAAIGAAAWVPQIVEWIWRAGSQPKLRVRAGGNLQVGHTWLGGTLGLNIAITSERKDALVDGIRAVVTHERGDRRQFSWALATENQTELRSDAGASLQMSRTQTVLALKASTQALAERFISLNDSAEQPAFLAIQNEAKNVYGEQRTKGGVDWSTFLLEPAAEAVRREFARAFHWQEGGYRLEIIFSMVGGGDHTERFEFNLAREDVEQVRANLDRWGEGLSAAIGGGGWLNWNWSYPTLVRR